MKVLHIAPHVGGGVGSVLKGFFQESARINVENDLYCLDYCRFNYDDITPFGQKKQGLGYSSVSNYVDEFKNYDVILVHYWNHPLLARALLTANWSSTKVVFWCHHSGLSEPHIIPNYIVRLASKVLFTSSSSLKAPNLKKFINRSPDRFGVVHSTSDLRAWRAIGAKRTRSNATRRGLYLGTVAYSKMHPHSTQILARLSKMGLPINIVGGPDQVRFQHEVHNLGGKIQVYGQVNDVLKFYEHADFFLYPLRRGHFGTGEQVILEAMAAGLPVIAFNNPAETAIIQHGETGFLAESANDFVQKVRLIADDKLLREKLSLNALRDVDKTFNHLAMVRKLLDHLRIVVGCEQKIGGDVPAEVGSDEFAIFAISSFFDTSVVEGLMHCPKEAVDLVYEKICGYLDAPYQNEVWLSKQKSSFLQYLSFFPDNPKLQEISYRISEKFPSLSIQQV